MSTIDTLEDTEKAQGSAVDHTEKHGQPLGAHHPFEQSLREIAERRRAAGIQERELGILFQDLHVLGLGATASHQDTVGSLFHPANILSSIQEKRHPPIRDILNGFDGVIRPGEMLLVLGRPDSGCSTFLKALSNRRDEYYAVQGEVNYDGLDPDVIHQRYRGDVVYCPEDDVHFPTLTVAQTIRFAARLRAPRDHLATSRSNYADELTALLLKTFGLEHAKDTLIGDAIIHGISGGEKKRVSLCEALATRACITAWDNATRGLDSSTALEFVQNMRAATDICRLTTVMSLYQASESIYELFDKVCLIYEGRMAYYGPASQARQYFIDLGYEPANRQTTPDFLVSVTDPNARIPRQVMHAPPRSAAEFASYFKASALGWRNKEEISSMKDDIRDRKEGVETYQASAEAEHGNMANLHSPYIQSLFVQSREVVIRRAFIFKGSLFVTVANLVAFAFQGIIIGTAFLKSSETTAAFFSRSGVLYFALLFAALMAMSEIPALFSQRPIVLRHRHWALYHPFIEAVALTLVDAPVSFLTSLVFGGLLYGLVGLQKTAGQFFIFFLFVFVVAVVMRAYFRALAAMCKSQAAAQTLAGISVLAMAMYTGYTIPQNSMIWALRWITYINPFRYGFESLMTNEFHTLKGTCVNLVPQGPAYQNISLSNQVCTTVGAIPGQPFVQGSRFVELSLGYLYSNLWRNLGIVFAFGAAFATALFTFTEVNTKTSGYSAVILYKQGTTLDTRSGSSDEEKPRSGGPAGKANAGSSTPDIAEHVRSDDVFSFTHVSYTIPTGKSQTIRLLEDVSGYVVPGKLTALMGESGAGKTTLLNVLAQRVDIGVVSGERLINGHLLPQDFQSQTGYCQQIDTHLPRSTIKEAMLFSAKLRQPAHVSQQEKEEYVDQCLRMCGLWAYRDAMIGSLNVELRKRTTIGVELAAKPRLLLFLDEPTSGLDSQSAWNIVLFLRSLADQGQAILCTIHQPSAELFQCFDRVLLLKKGGQTVYFGDLGHHAEILLRYFESNGARKCSPNENPAEYMLDVIGAGATATTDQDWYALWHKSAESETALREIEDVITSGQKRGAIETTLRTEFPTSWVYQLVELVKRGALDHYRNPVYIISKVVLNIFAGLFIGFSFFKAEHSLQGAQNKLFAMFMPLILSVPLSNQLMIPFLDTRAVYEIRERPSRIYSWTALVSSLLIVELPWNLIGSSLFFVSWYWSARLPTDRAGYAYLLTGVIFPIYYTTIAQSFASMSPNAEVAAIIFGFLFSFVLNFNGVMQPYRQLGWWKWMYHVSPFTYLIEGLVGEVLGHQQTTCSPVEFVHVNPPSGMACAEYMEPYISMAGGYLSNPDATSDCAFCSTASTDQFLEQSFNIFYSHRWRDAGIFLGFALLNLASIYLFMYLFRIRKGSLFKKTR